jgi:hypothetical protein
MELQRPAASFYLLDCLWTLLVILLLLLLFLLMFGHCYYCY